MPAGELLCIAIIVEKERKEGKKKKKKKRGIEEDPSLVIHINPKQCILGSRDEGKMKAQFCVFAQRSTTRSLFSVLPIISQTSSMLVGPSGVLHFPKSHSDHTRLLHFPFAVLSHALSSFGLEP